MNNNLHLIASNKKILSLYEEGAVFCAFDTETSGQNPENSNIIEIGAVKFTKDGILEKFSSLIKVQSPLNPFIVGLTGINDQMLENAPLAEKIIPEFRNFCKETILVAHNAQFDLRFMNAESQRLGFLPLQNSAVDTLRLSRIMLPENRSWKQTFLADQFLHIAIIVVLWFSLYGEGIEISHINAFCSAKVWLAVMAYMLMLRPSSILLGLFLKQWVPSSSNSQSLPKAGQWIGYIERVLILTFVLVGSFEGVGFLLAAKSVFRFGELNKSKEIQTTEYVLIGTFASFTIAILTGIAITHLYL